MPFAPSDADSHTTKASTPRLKQLWSSTANGVLRASGNEKKAITSANAAVARSVTAQQGGR